jgi:hypothetical protein
MQFFDEADDDTPEKRIGKIIGAIIVTIIYSGVAALMIYAALQGLH